MIHEEGVEEQPWEEIEEVSPTLSNVELFEQGLRRCNRCPQIKPLDDKHFFRDKDGPQGWSRKCKDCDRAYQNQRNARLRRGLHTPAPLGANQATYAGTAVDLGGRPREG